MNRYHSHNVSITFHCDAPSHAGERPDLATFTRADGTWRPLMVYTRDDGILAMVPETRGATILDPDTGAPRPTSTRREPFAAYFNADGDQVDPSSGEQVRASFGLRCPRCGDHERIGGEELVPILTRAADAQMVHMTLRQLRAVRGRS